MTQKPPTGDELTEKALSHAKWEIDGQSYRLNYKVDYDSESRLFRRNPLKDVKDGKHYNWNSKSSGFLPCETEDGTINLIRSFDTIPEGIAYVAEIARQRFDEYTDGKPVSKEEFVGIIREIAFRFGRGAWGESYVAETLISHGKEVLPEVEGDEDSKIDIRTGNTLKQVKLAEEPRSDWNEPEANVEEDENRQKEIVWVTENGEILANRKDEYRLEDRYTPIL